MSEANTSISISDLNFFDLKKNLKTYLSSKAEFSDYDYEGSVMSTLVDLLAYNTYVNSFYSNMIANEMFIDSATMRASVSSIAKSLNYLPRSAKSAKAQLYIEFYPSDSPVEIIIPRGTKFTSRIDANTFEFTTDTEYAVPSVSGVYRKTIDVVEGFRASYNFPYTTGMKPYFTVPLGNLDTDSIRVYVKDSVNSTRITEYTPVTDITEINSTSKVYYIQEDIDQRYQVYFGDGVLGASLLPNNIVIIEARESSGSMANGCNSFSNVSYTGYNRDTPTSRYQATILSVISSAQDGQDKESLESIKFNAPRSFESQNRLITTSDYKQFLFNRYSDIQSISVWGGEENIPPFYGKIIMAIKPVDGFLISENRKNTIISDMKKYNAMSIDVLIVDPSFIFITPTITVNYDSKKTSLSSDAILTNISLKVKEFESLYLSKFDNAFKYSKFLSAIDSTDKSITSNKTTILLEKRFYPAFGSILTYKIDFENPIVHPFDGYQGAVKSSKFKLYSSPYDLYLDDDGYGKIRTYYLNSSLNKVYVNENAGQVNYDTGVILLSSFIYSSISGDEMSIIVEPRNNDITPHKTQVILFSKPTVTLFDESTNRITGTIDVEVLGNTSPIKSDGVLNTVVI